MTATDPRPELAAMLAARLGPPREPWPRSQAEAALHDKT